MTSHSVDIAAYRTIAFFLGKKCLLMLVISVVLFLTPAASLAQSWRKALDSDVYQPRMGVSGEIDSLYGTYNDQRFGDLAPGGPDAEGREQVWVWSQGLGLDDISTQYGLHLNNLQVVNHTGVDLRQCVFGHFRSSKYRDAIHDVDGEERVIYWQNDLGGYDTQHKTVLKGDPSWKFYGLDNGNLIILPLSSDSLDDLVTYWQHAPDTGRFVYVYLSYYKGSHLYGRDTVFADSTIYCDTSHGDFGYRPGAAVGQFFGTDRTQLIAPDLEENLFIYRNDSAFSMSRFLNAMRFDTLWTFHENPQLASIPDYAYLTGPYVQTMKCFPKAAWDKSDDFLCMADVRRAPGHYQNQHVFCFRGGSHFGEKHLLLDSADFILSSPGEYEYPNPPTIYTTDFRGNCGDMTGTGNNVLLLEALPDPLVSLRFFYVLGRALDDKADMYFQTDPDAGGPIDTITADRDHLQDVILGNPGYYHYEDHLNLGWHDVGLIQVLHGSTKIPVRETARFGVANPESRPNGVEIFPNPASSTTTVRLHDSLVGHASLSVRDVLGREVRHQETSGGIAKFSLATGALSSGWYQLRIVADGKSYVSRLMVQH
jgi:hypothetical protein